MHRHKALIQCARIAFGFVGIYDQDEAERIIEKDVTPVKESFKSIGHADLDSLSDDDREFVDERVREFVMLFDLPDMPSANEIYDEMMGNDPELASSFKYLIGKERMSVLRKYRSATKREGQIAALMAPRSKSETA
jgi:hypothetical protein